VQLHLLLTQIAVAGCVGAGAASGRVASTGCDGRVKGKMLLRKTKLWRPRVRKEVQGITREALL